MKIFHCDHCRHLVFFENVACVKCGHKLGYLPDAMIMASLESAGDDRWRSPAPSTQSRIYRLCRNYVEENVCNWAVSADEADSLCRSCRLTRVIPDLSQPSNRLAWYRLETAKRRLVYSLLRLGLPLTSKADDPKLGLQFQFLADKADAKVMTGHAHGIITVNLAEADDAERERRRLQMREPYRTLLGHFRHEAGHHYWDRLIKGTKWEGPCRDLFGNEQDDYAKALERHYQSGAPAAWQDRFVSAYAAAHPWEDWAETWAHYLHMTDTLEMAAACGLKLEPRRPDEPALESDPRVSGSPRASFDSLIDQWYPLTYVLNNLNRGLGLQDAYPFLLPSPVVGKLRFVHDVIVDAN